MGEAIFTKRVSMDAQKTWFFSLSYGKIKKSEPGMEKGIEEGLAYEILTKNSVFKRHRPMYNKSGEGR